VRSNDDKLAIRMREHFAVASCVRPRLTVRSTAELRLRFRSWRDAGITWAIIRGDGIEKVQRRAGHKLIATTQRYIVEAENRGAKFGVPFPPLPASLLEASSKRASKLKGSERRLAAIADDFLYRRRDSNPHALSDGGF
jgi:hypothetical protein